MIRKLWSFPSVIASSSSGARNCRCFCARLRRSFLGGVRVMTHYSCNIDRLTPLRECAKERPLLTSKSANLSGKSTKRRFNTCQRARCRATQNPRIHREKPPKSSATARQIAHFRATENPRISRKKPQKWTSKPQSCAKKRTCETNPSASRTLHSPVNPNCPVSYTDHTPSRPSTRESPLPVLRSPFSIPNSPFDIPHSSFAILYLLVSMASFSRFTQV